MVTGKQYFEYSDESDSLPPTASNQAIEIWIRMTSRTSINWYNEERVSNSKDPECFDQSSPWKPLVIPIGDGCIWSSKTVGRQEARSPGEAAARNDLGTAGWGSSFMSHETCALPSWFK